MFVRSLAVSLLVATSLTLPGGGWPAPPAAHAVAQAQAVAMADVPVRAARPRATAAAVFTTMAGGAVRLVVTSNATKVQVRYRTAQNKKRTKLVTIRRGTGVKRLPAGSTRIAVRA